MDRLMQVLDVSFSSDNGNTYQIKAIDGKDSNTYFYAYIVFSSSIFILDETYFPGRCAQIIYRGNVIGLMGVLHPEVISAYELTMPCSAFEINLEPFL